MIRNRFAMAGAASIAALGLAACGGGTTKTAATPVPSASASAAAGAGAARGFGGLSSTELAKATACLKAAGIAVPTLGARPSGAPAGEFGGGTPPSGAPAGGFGGGTPPSGAPMGGSGTRPGGGLFSSTAAKAALAACGITLPTTGGAAAPTAAPTAST